jgi:hypothetical protein
MAHWASWSSRSSAPARDARQGKGRGTQKAGKQRGLKVLQKETEQPEFFGRFVPFADEPKENTSSRKQEWQQNVEIDTFKQHYAILTGGLWLDFHGHGCDDACVHQLKKLMEQQSSGDSSSDASLLGMSGKNAQQQVASAKSDLKVRWADMADDDRWLPDSD